MAVDLAALGEQLDRFPGPPYLVTTGPSGPAHLVSVAARFEEGLFLAPAGRTTTANVAAQPAVTLLWAPEPGGPYSLIVDGEAEVTTDGSVAVVPTRAVLHRVAGADDGLPTCLPLEQGR